MAVKLNSSPCAGAIERAVVKPSPETFPVGFLGSNQREAAMSRKGRHHSEHRPNPFPSPSPNPVTPDNSDSFLDDLDDSDSDDLDNSGERKIKRS